MQEMVGEKFTRRIWENNEYKRCHILSWNSTKLLFI